MSRKSKFVQNTLVLSIGAFLPKFATVITIPLLTACLTKEEYGTYDLFVVLVSLLLPALTLQIQTVAFRYLVDEKDSIANIKSIVSTIFAFSIPVSLVSLIVLWFVMPVDNRIVKVFICGYFFVDIIANTTRQIARGLQRNLDYSLSAVISAFGKLIFVSIFVWYLKLGLIGATISLFLASLISWIILAYRVKLIKYISVSSVSKNQLNKLISYSWPMVPNNMSMWVMRLSDRFVVTAFLGVSWNAIYAVANKIPGLLSLAQSPFTMAWQENASIVSKDHDASAYYSDMFQTMFDFIAGFLGLLICMTPVLFKILIRGDYDDAYAQMPLLFLAHLFYAMATFLGGIYVAYKKTKSVGITTMIAAIVNLLIDLTTIRFIGLYAASISTLISYTVLFVYRMVDVQKIVFVKIKLGHIFLVVSILLLELFLCFLRLPITDIINGVLGLIVFAYLDKSVILRLIKLLKNQIMH